MVVGPFAAVTAVLAAVVVQDALSPDELLATARSREAAGDREGAARAYEAAVELADREAIPRRRAELRVELANHCLAAGDTVRAREVLLAALPLVEGDARATIGIHGELGNLHLRVGDYRAARESYRMIEASRIPGLETRARYQLGIVHRLLGEMDAAREALDSALEDPSGTWEPYELAQVLNELAILHGELGLGSERLAYHERALELALGEGGDAAIVAVTLLNLVDAHEDAGEYDRARAVQVQALEAARAAGDGWLVATGEANLAYLDLLSGDAERALGAAHEASAKLAGGRSERPLLEALDTMARAALALGREDAAEDALRRSEVELERPALAALSPRERSEWRARFAGWERSAQDLVRLRIEAADEASAGSRAAEGLVAAGRWKGRALEEELSAARLPASPEDVVELLRERAVPPGCALIEYSSGWERLYAYVLTADELRHLDLGPRQEIERDVTDFVRCLERRDPLAPMTEVAERGSRLHARLLAPALAVAGPGVGSLVVVPTPALAALPFEALVAGEGEGGEVEFVIDHHRVSYAPSHAFLLRSPSGARRSVSTRVLLLADPEYSLDSPSPGRGLPDPERLGRLLGTRDEALELVRLLLVDSPDTSAEQFRRFAELRSQRSFAFTEHAAIDLFVGREARAERLAGDLTGYTLIHVACHGFADEERPENTALALAATEGGTGFVSLGHLEGLRIDAELTVLAACQTARGRVRRGEGVLSVARAFLAAGSRSVVASLWVVDDEKARRTMEELFRNLIEEDQSPAEALHDAKLTVRAAAGSRGVGVETPGADVRVEAGHPHFWAPFVHVGRAGWN